MKNDQKRRKYPARGSSLEIGQTASSQYEGNINSNNHLLQQRNAEATQLTLKKIGVKQQKTTLGASLVS